MSLTAMARDWIRRLAALYRQAADPLPGHEWLTALRIRILCYLINRYEGQSPATPSDGPEGGNEPPRSEPPTYCIVDEPVDHPPRSTCRLGSLLEDIRRLNVRPVPRWRDWIRRLIHRNGGATAGL